MKMIKNYLWQLFALCIVTVAFSACSSDDDESIATGAIQLISEGEITCLAEESEVLSIDFSASGKWTARASVGWITLAKRSGDAGENLSIPFTVAANDLFKQRVGVITIKDPDTGKSVDVTVIQGEKGAKIVFSDEDGATLQIDEEKKEIIATVKVTSNYDWSIEVDKDWLTYKKEADGKNSFNVTFYADPDKLYKAGGYGAQKAIASFIYNSETRTPAVKTYEVNFEGITPALTFGEENVVLEDVYYEGEYKKTVTVTSNFKWDLAEKPEFAYVGYNVHGASDETLTNNSVNFFSTETTIYFELKEDELDTEQDRNGVQKFIDANTREILPTILNVSCPAAGKNYTFIDAKDFPRDDTYGVYMFEAGEEWQNQFKTFTVRCGAPEKLQFFIVRLPNGYSEPVKSFYDAYGEEADSDMTGAYQWGMVYEPEEQTRSVVTTSKWDLGIQGRKDNEYGSKSDEDRYFALFAVCPDTKIEFGDLFDAEGYLKEEYVNSYITLGQKAKQVEFYFNSVKLPENGTVLEFSAEGETIDIDYESNADPDYNGLELYENVKVTSSDDPFAWTGDFVYQHEYISADFSESSTISLTLKSNDTGKARTISAAFAVYVPNRDNAYLVRTFTIKQPAKEN